MHQSALFIFHWYSFSLTGWWKGEKSLKRCYNSFYLLHHTNGEIHVDIQFILVQMLKVTQAAFAVACFWGLSDIHESSNGLQTVPTQLDKQTAGCNSPHDWLMSLAMGLAALVDMWRWKWYQWMPFGCL